MANQSPPNTSYKIYPFYNMVFYSCLSLYQRDKMTEFLIKAYFNYDEISDMPRYKQPELLVMMLNEIKNTGKPIQYFFKYLNHERIVELKELSMKKKVNWSDHRIVLNVRIPKEKKELIADLGRGLETRGEIIELAIANYIANCSDTYFKMIKFSFINHISSS